MSQATVKHPLFARVYTRVAPGLDKKGGAEHRDELLAGLTGRVIEVGAGIGSNFEHYPDTVEEVVAVEPEPYLRDKAAESAARAPVKVTIVDGVADRLPAGDGEFDAGVASLVLCSVPDQRAALAELHRVIRAGGELRFYEHVVARSARFARAQHIVDPVWTRIAGGCHLDRDTAAAIEAARFSVESIRRFSFHVSLLDRLAAPQIVGVARRQE